MKVKCIPVISPSIAVFILLLQASPSVVGSPGDTVQLGLWVQQTEMAFLTLQQEFLEAGATEHSRLCFLNKALAGPDAQTPENGYPLILEKLRLEAELRALENTQELKQLRLRYRKGIEILKILYEKLLSLDHHFSSLYTSQQISRIGNPHEYPEFKKIKSMLDERMKKKYGFGLPALLENNPYLAATYSLLSLALSGSDTRQDKQQLEQLSCILDFTVQMNQQLNIIYFETEYLRDANRSLKTSCETLFAECTKPIGYTLSLQYCREHDDWEKLYQHLDQYLEDAQKAVHETATIDKRTKNNLQFAIDRIVHFLDKYCAFIAQCSEYYKKFEKIATGYEHETYCSAVLPETFNHLKTDIQTTLDKFNSAYILPELSGSRLKDLLYGFDE